MKMDYCTMLVHDVERALLPLHINSLRHHMANYWNSFKISVRPDDFETIELCEQLGVEALRHPTYTQMVRDINNSPKQGGFDNANRLNKLLEACNTDWVVLSHIDIIWTGDPMSEVYALANDNYGMLGIWPHGSIAINRKVYNECHHGFWPLQVCGRKYDTWVELIGHEEAQLKGDNFTSIPVPGVDVGILLKMEIQDYGYRFRVGIPMSYFHVGSASCHDSPDYLERPEQMIIRKATEDRIQFALDEFKIFK